MTMLMLASLFTALLVGMAVFFVSMSMRGVRSRASIEERLDEYLQTGAGPAVSALDLELSESFFKRAILPTLRRMLTFLAWMWPRNRVDSLRQRLLLAGQPGRMSTGDFIGLKGWCMILIGGGIASTAYLLNYPRTLTSLLLWVLITLISFFLPDIWLSRKIKTRQTEIVSALPDALDMLVISVEAGLSFENAIIEIAQRWRNALALELMQAQREIGMGQSRRQALLAMNARVGVPDVSAFVSAMNQAEELGVSIARVLAVQAEEMRIKRRQRAQEMANKAPIKMLFPMVFLIFPALFAVLLGPAVPQLLGAMNGL